MIRTSLIHRLAAGASVALVAGLLAVPTALRAQTAGVDPRWQAWIGCWAPADADGRTAGDAAPLVCVAPAEGTSAVDLATVKHGQIVRRERVDATGAARDIARNECTGTRSTRWSEQGVRLYLRTEERCRNGLTRTASGLYSITPSGEWLDVESVTLGGNTGVRVQRYRPVAVPASVAGELGGIETRRDGAAAARVAAGASLTMGDIVDASAALDSGVVRAWLVERRQGFALDAKRLETLAGNGVPGSVIDAMVALSYPKTFAIGADGETQLADQPEARAAEPMYGPGPVAVIDPFYGAGLGCYTPLSCAAGYGYYSPYGYSPYGYSPYGYGPYWPGYGWYGGGGPVIVVREPARPHGRMVIGDGYHAAPGANSGRGAHGSAPEPSARVGGGSGSAAGGAGSTQSAPARTAHKKP